MNTIIIFSDLPQLLKAMDSEYQILGSHCIECWDYGLLECDIVLFGR
jgi:hypothetical protein